MITVRRVDADHPDAHALWAEQQADLARRYNAPDLVLESSFPTLVDSLVGYAEDGEPVASIVLRWSPFETGAGSLELKRLFVRPGHRGHGHSKVLMGAAEAIARRAGATRIVLETGTEQPEALALYDRLGYDRIAPYGEYKDEPDSVCYGRELPPRLLVILGGLGAGKTTVAAAVHELLGSAGARTAYVDGDALVQAYPTPADDPDNARMLVRALEFLARLHRERGIGNTVLAYTPDSADLLRALAGAVGGRVAADVAVVRVTAPLDARLERLERRAVSERVRAWSRARTAELDDILDALELEDVTVDTDGRDPADVAAEALDAVGWTPGGP